MEISAAFDAYLLGLLAKQPEERPTAQQVSDWFRTDAWRGLPEPLPAQTPTSHRATAPMAPRPSPAAPPAPVGPTTYRLPGPTGRRRQAPARSAPARRRRSTREAIRRRPRVASAIAGTATFLAAVYLGMILFSPDSSSAGTPDQSPPSAPSVPSQDAGDGDQQQGTQQQERDGDGEEDGEDERDD